MKRLINLFRSNGFEQILLWVYVVFIPLSGTFYFYLGSKKVGFNDFIFIGLLLICLIKYAGGKIEFKKTGLEKQFIFMLALFLPSLINSRDIFNSLTEFLGLAYLFLLFIIIINILTTKERIHNLMMVYFIISAVLSFVGLLYLGLYFVTGRLLNDTFLAYTPIEKVAHHFPRLNLTFETPNMLLIYLHVALVFGAILLLSGKSKKSRSFVLSLIILILIAAFFTGSRRYAGLLLTLFLFFSWFARGRIGTVFKYLTFSSFLVFLIASIMTTIWVIFPVKITKVETEKAISFKADYGYSIHLIPLATSIKMFKEHPIAGIGFGTYSKRFKQYANWEWFRSSFGFTAYPEHLKAVQNRTFNVDPHSLFLGTLAETGILGFLGLMYFILKILTLLIKRFKVYCTQDKFQRIIYGCILAGFLGFLLNSLNIDLLSMRPFWIMLAVGFSYI